MSGVPARWLGIVLAVMLGVAGVLLLLLLANTYPAQFDSMSRDYILMLSVLSVVIIFTLLFLLREILRRIWQSGGETVHEQSLAEHQRFLKRLDHELKNPLTALRVGLGSLALTLHDEQQRAIVNTLAEDAARMSRLVTDLRKLAEIDVTALDIQPIQISAFCEQIRELMSEQPQYPHRICRLECPESANTLPVLIGDPDLLLLALHNLLDNSFKYTHHGEHVTVRFFEKDLDCVIQVADTGIGIPPQEIAHICEDMYRGSNVESIPGNGIGLALVRSIVERHYGTIQVESQPGQGTVVNLRLPLK